MHRAYSTRVYSVVLGRLSLTGTHTFILPEYIHLTGTHTLILPEYIHSSFILPEHIHSSYRNTYIHLTGTRSSAR